MSKDHKTDQVTGERSVWLPAERARVAALPEPAADTVDWFVPTEEINAVVMPVEGGPADFVPADAGQRSAPASPWVPDPDATPTPSPAVVEADDPPAAAEAVDDHPA